MSVDNFFKRVLYYAFNALFLITPLLWTPKMSELFEFPKMLLVYFLTLVIVVSGVIVMISREEWVLKKTFLDVPIFLFLLSQIISTFLSIDVRTSIFGYYSRFHGGLLSSFSYIALYYFFVSFINLDEAKGVFKSLLVGGILSALYAFPEHFGVSPSCSIIGSGLRADCWVQDVVLRVFGTFGQPNWLAAFLISIMYIPLTILFDEQGNFLFIKKYGKKKKLTKFEWRKLFPLLIFVLFFLILLFTKSRSGLLGFGVSAILFSILFVLIFKKKKTAFLTVGFLGALVFALYILFGKGVVVQLDKYFHPEKKEANVEVIEDNKPTVKTGTVLELGGTESLKIRKIVWKGALDIFKNNPIFGTGVETFAYSYYNYRPVEHNLVSEWDFLYNKAHNEFLNILANTGAFGLATYLLMMIVFAKKSFEIMFNDEYNFKDKVISASLLSGYLALAISNYYGFSTVMVGVLFFIFPGFLLILTETEVNDDEETTIILDNFRSGVVFLLITLSLFLSYKIFKIYLGDKAYSSAKALASQEDIRGALTLYDKAIKYQKNEPLYMDEFSKTAANAALSLYAQKQATAAAELSRLSIQISSKALEKNDVHLNFYKSRAKILANLGSYEPYLLPAAEDVMRQALVLSPTDPKLYFSLGLVLNEQNKIKESFEAIEKSIELKPNYGLARYTLGEMYQIVGKTDQAIEQIEYFLKYINPDDKKAQAKYEELVKK